MKTFLFIVTVGIFSFHHLLAQTTIPKHYELSGDAYHQADSMLSVWTTTEYPIILKKKKLKMSCAKCESVYMDVIFIIANEGNLIDYEVLKMNKCGLDFPEELRLQFIFFFSRNKFPPALRGMHIEFRLGTGLKC